MANNDMAAAPTNEKSAVDEKSGVEHVEQYSNHSDEKHPDYFNGMRIDGEDGEDHMHEPPMTFSRAMSLLAMGFMWVGSQIPLYLFGAIPPYIYGDIGGTDRWVWFVLGGLLALAGVCPFVGSLADLLGRRWVAMMGASLLVIGTVVATTAQVMGQFIGA
ncbi:uncharacterized protein LTR77_000108 [Saxophila tyrrhenica]|uniref:Major facilitator superfamily (MFS) profile domain-containing protein n=1 Tax=Saxophila tyrrhenica TaxID=1690608 RepID=A0AAV9PQ85_9PEZI|nr:hypothetical protein LTR77_000108 [Saxophila tyrrhenica]